MGAPSSGIAAFVTDDGRSFFVDSVVFALPPRPGEPAVGFSLALGLGVGLNRGGVGSAITLVGDGDAGATALGSDGKVGSALGTAGTDGSGGRLAVGSGSGGSVGTTSGWTVA